MKTAMAESSLIAFHAHRANGRLTRQQRDIFAFLCKHAHRDFTRKELSRALNMEPGTVAGRVNELRDELHLIEDLPIRRCSVSGNSAHPVRLADPQVELFA